MIYSGISGGSLHKDDVYDLVSMYSDSTGGLITLRRYVSCLDRHEGSNGDSHRLSNGSQGKWKLVVPRQFLSNLMLCRLCGEHPH